MTKQNMPDQNRLLFIGEPMLELTSSSNDTLRKSYAGDAYNSSVYLKRAFPSNTVQFMTAVGSDALSQDFLQVVSTENIDASLIAESQNKHLGAYMVQNDEHGERSFIYWRSDSAAKKMMSLLKPSLNEKTLKGLTSIFFSGITLAILDDSERAAFWEFIADARQQGVLVIFDPNYRAILWDDLLTAQQQFEIAYQHSDWLMPGVDDFSSLYSINTVEECIEFCRPYQFKELIIKNGEQPVTVVTAAGTEVHAIKQSQNVVDTTSAGDAFNGIYIGARFAGQSIQRAVQMANHGAMKVIETPGAIMPKALFMDAIEGW